MSPARNKALAVRVPGAGFEPASSCEQRVLRAQAVPIRLPGRGADLSPRRPRGVPPYEHAFPRLHPRGSGAIGRRAQCQRDRPGNRRSADDRALLAFALAVQRRLAARRRAEGLAAAAGPRPPAGTRIPVPAWLTVHRASTRASRQLLRVSAVRVQQRLRRHSRDFLRAPRPPRRAVDGGRTTPHPDRNRDAPGSRET